MSNATLKQLKNTFRERVKLLVLGALLAFAFITPQLAPQKARAWTGNLPQCSTGETFNFNWKDKIKESPVGGTYYNYDAPPSSLLVVGTNLGSYYNYSFYFGTPSATAQYQQSGSNRNFYISDAVIFSVTGDTASGNYHNVTGRTNVGALNSGSMTCVVDVRNFTVGSGYNGQLYTYNNIQQTITCDTFDVACNIRNAINGVTDTVSSGVEFVLRGVSALFMPSEEFVQDKFTEVNDYFSEKLGFLLYPFEFIADFYDAATNDITAWCTPTVCEKDFGNLFGGNFTIDFYALKPSTALWDLLLVVIRSLTVLGLIFFARRELLKILKGH